VVKNFRVFVEHRKNFIEELKNNKKLFQKLLFFYNFGEIVMISKDIFENWRNVLIYSKTEEIKGLL